MSPFYKFNDLVFVSGQIGMDSQTGTIPADFEQQTRNTLQNVAARLNEAGLEKENAIKLTVYLTDMSQFAQMNQIYQEFFGDHKPARTTIGAAQLLTYPDAPKLLIEIDAIAG